MIQYQQVIEYIFYGSITLLGGSAIFIGKRMLNSFDEMRLSLDDVKDSVEKLNTTLAVEIVKSNALKNMVEKHDERLDSVTKEVGDIRMLLAANQCGDGCKLNSKKGE